MNRKIIIAVLRYVKDSPVFRRQCQTLTLDTENVSLLLVHCNLLEDKASLIFSIKVSEMFTCLVVWCLSN